MSRTKVTRPYADTKLDPYLRRRVLQLKPIKSQAEIASEAGFTSLNMLSMLCAGSTRLPLDRIPQLAKALDCDPAHLLQLGLDQQAPAPAAIFPEIVEVVTQNERSWLAADPRGLSEFGSFCHAEGRSCCSRPFWKVIRRGPSGSLG